MKKQFIILHKSDFKSKIMIPIEIIVVIKELSFGSEVTGSEVTIETKNGYEDFYVIETIEEIERRMREGA